MWGSITLKMRFYLENSELILDFFYLNISFYVSVFIQTNTLKLLSLTQKLFLEPILSTPLVGFFWILGIICFLYNNLLFCSVEEVCRMGFFARRNLRGLLYSAINKNKTNLIPETNLELRKNEDLPIKIIDQTMSLNQFHWKLSVFFLVT